MFDNIVFSDICAHVPDFKEELETCQSYSQGILTKGTYSTVIKYIFILCRYCDYLYLLSFDFFNSKREPFEQYYFMNSKEMTMIDQMQSKYLNISLSLLSTRLQNDIWDLYIYTYF